MIACADVGQKPALEGVDADGGGQQLERLDGGHAEADRDGQEVRVEDGARAVADRVQLDGVRLRESQNSRSFPAT